MNLRNYFLHISYNCFGGFSVDNSKSYAIFFIRSILAEHVKALLKAKLANPSTQHHTVNFCLGRFYFVDIPLQ